MFEVELTDEEAAFLIESLTDRMLVDHAQRCENLIVKIQRAARLQAQSEEQAELGLTH